MSDHRPEHQGYVVAIDQGTTSTRCILFDHAGRLVAVAQREHRQHYPRPGWVEHDAAEIWRNVARLVPQAMAQVDAVPADVVAIGITNQRETVVAWDRRTGDPVGPAVVWQDTRTADLVEELSAEVGADRFTDVCGLPLTTYFSGPRIAWMLQADAGLRRRAESGDVLFGTIDSWLVWNLTGGPDGGRHVTDVTNASRTMLMDLATLDYSPQMLEVFGVPRRSLPQIVPSSQVYGRARTVVPGPSSEPPSATSRPRCSARRASPPGTPSARTGRAASC